MQSSTGSSRRRVPYKFNQGEDHEAEDDGILDEQEQERVVESLREETQAADALHRVLAVAVLALSCFLNLSYLVGPHEHTPLDVFFDHPPSSAIPLAAALGVLHVLLHLNQIIRFVPPATAWLQDRSLPVPIPLPYTPCFGIGAIAPALSVLLGKGVPATAWWSVTLLMIWLSYSFERWNEHGVDSIRELEGLKYTAPGA